LPFQYFLKNKNNGMNPANVSISRKGKYVERQLLGSYRASFAAYLKQNTGRTIRAFAPERQRFLSTASFRGK